MSPSVPLKQSIFPLFLFEASHPVVNKSKSTFYIQVLPSCSRLVIEPPQTTPVTRVRIKLF